jgi:hypothetical protein
VPAEVPYVQIRKSPGGAVTPRGATPGVEVLMQSKSTVYRPAREDEDTHPHACTGGLVFLAYTAPSTRRSARR